MNNFPKYQKHFPAQGEISPGAKFPDTAENISPTAGL
jgi:hypothetical protein